MGVIGVIIAATGMLKAVAAAASFTILLYYWLANLAAIWMPHETKLFPDAVPIIGIVTCTLLVMVLPAQAIVTGLGVLTLGLIGRLVTRR